MGHSGAPRLQEGFNASGFSVPICENGNRRERTKGGKSTGGGGEGGGGLVVSVAVSAVALHGNLEPRVCLRAAPRSTARGNNPPGGPLLWRSPKLGRKEAERKEESAGETRREKGKRTGLEYTVKQTFPFVRVELRYPTHPRVQVEHSGLLLFRWTIGGTKRACFQSPRPSPPCAPLESLFTGRARSSEIASSSATR